MTEVELDIMNLCNIAEDHRKHCNESTCNVSLYLLHRTIIRLIGLSTAISGKHFIDDKVRERIDSINWL